MLEVKANHRDGCRVVNLDKIRGADRARLLDEAERIVENYDVFLAGPYVEVEKPADDAVNSDTEAKSLRYKLYHELTNNNHRVYLGEDVQLRLNGEAHYGPLANAVIYERHHILHRTDMLIVLPSSPGSFCEFGDWASDKIICGKMLVIVDRPHEGIPNYINDGVTKFASSNGATVNYLAYADTTAAFDACRKFINLVASKKRIDKLYGR